MLLRSKECTFGEMEYFSTGRHTHTLYTSDVVGIVCEPWTRKNFQQLPLSLKLKLNSPVRILNHRNVFPLLPRVFFATGTSNFITSRVKWMQIIVNINESHFHNVFVLFALHCCECDKNWTNENETESKRTSEHHLKNPNYLHFNQIFNWFPWFN